MQIRIPSKETAQKIASAIVGFTTARVVKTVISNNIDDDLSKAQKAQAWVGTAAIAMVVSDATEKWTDEFVEKLYVGGSEVKKQIDQQKTSTITE